MKKSLFALALTGALALTAAQADTVLYGSIRLGVTYGYNHDKVPGNAWVDPVISTSTNAWEHFAPVKSGKRGASVDDEGSRFGLKGGEELGNGVKVIYQLEWGFNAADGGNNGEGFKNRLAYIGLQGEFGTFVIGRVENPFANTINKRSEADSFNSSYTSASMMAAGDVMFGGMGSINTFDAKMWSRVGNAVAYISPTWNGFSFNVAAIMNQGFDGSVADPQVNIYNKNRNVDIYTINLSYVHESGFYANAGYISADLGAIDAGKRATAYGLQVGFDNEQWGVNANFVRGENKSASTFGAGNLRSGAFWGPDASAPGANWGYDATWSAGNPGLFQLATGGAGHDTSFKNKTTGWDIGGHFSFGPDYASTVRLTVGQVKGKKTYSSTATGVVSGNDYMNFAGREQNKLTTWAIGFEQKLSSRTRVWAEYQNNSVKQDFSKSWAGVDGGATVTTTGTDYADSAFRSKKFKDDKFSIGIRHDF